MNFKDFFIVILIISILIMGTFFSFKVKELNYYKNLDENKENIEEVKNKIKVLNFYPSSVAITYNNNLYVNVGGATSDINNLYGEGMYNILIDTKKEYINTNFDDFKITDGMNMNISTMKLNVDNVKMVYSYAWGQALDSNYGILILKNDGTVSAISLYSLINGKKDVYDIKDLNNIDYIFSENHHGFDTYAVDKNGKKIDVSDYLPKDYKAW